ncbi:MAG: sporulation protein YunB [Halanaerobiales bacterium]
MIFNKRKKLFIIKVIIIIFCFIILLLLFCIRALYPAFFALARGEAIKVSNKAINKAVNRETDYLNYEDLITYKCDNEGNIILMQPNTREINQLSSRISLNIQDRLEDQLSQSVNIPLGKLTGIDILAGFGPVFPVKIMFIGFTRPPDVVDSFQTAGINQTRHKIYLQTEVELSLIIPFSENEIFIHSDVPLVEVTILGRVPEVYVGFDGEKFNGIINEK